MKSKGIRSVIRSGSLTVTALSNGDACMISSPMKFQLRRWSSGADGFLHRSQLAFLLPLLVLLLLISRGFL